MGEKTITIGTDVATLVLFHPDDLPHRHADPIAWYAYDFAYRRESAAGRLVAFGTGSDGGFAVRLTTGGLTRREADLACTPWAFPLVVRHGRILLDNTDALPGEEQMVQPAARESWYDIAEGSYRATVHPIAAEEAGLPDYVVTFEPVADIAAIAVADTPPDLRPLRGREPAPMPGMATEHQFEWPRSAPAEAEVPALPVEPGIAVLPGQTVQFPVSDSVAEAVFPSEGEGPEALVLAPSFAAGGLAVLAVPNQLSRRGEEPAVLGVVGRHVVRIRRGARPQPLHPLAAAPLAKPAMAADERSVGAFRARLAEHAARDAAFRSRLQHPAFETERFASFASGEAMTTWALMHLDLPFPDRLALYASPLRERIAGLERILDGNGPGPDRPPSAIARLMERLWRR